MLNDLNALIGFEIELTIRGPIIYSQNLHRKASRAQELSKTSLVFPVP